jgi:hypothetical protein
VALTTDYLPIRDETLTGITFNNLVLPVALQKIMAQVIKDQLDIDEITKESTTGIKSYQDTISSSDTF